MPEPFNRPVMRPLVRPVMRPISRRLRLGALYAMSGVTLALSVMGLFVFGSALLYIGPFTLRFLPGLLHPTQDIYGISFLGWLIALVAVIISAALAVGFLYLLVVVGVSVVMLLRQLLSTRRGTSGTSGTSGASVASVLRSITQRAHRLVPRPQPQHRRVVSRSRRTTPPTPPTTPPHPGVSPAGDER